MNLSSYFKATIINGEVKRMYKLYSNFNSIINKARWYLNAKLDGTVITVLLRYNSQI